MNAGCSILNDFCEGWGILLQIARLSTFNYRLQNYLSVGCRTSLRFAQRVRVFFDALPGVRPQLRE